MAVDFDALDRLIGDALKRGLRGQMGKINIWSCKACQMPHICIDRDAGVTPFLIKCRLTPGCRGMAESWFYRLPPDTLIRPQFEWYRPRRDQSFPGEDDQGVVDHIQHGGLLLREIDEVG